MDRDHGMAALVIVSRTVSATAWHIVRYEDVNGNRIDYNYTNTAYNNTNHYILAVFHLAGILVQELHFKNSIVFNFKIQNVWSAILSVELFLCFYKILDNILRTNNTIF
jgi:hypothetical protein